MSGKSKSRAKKPDGNIIAKGRPGESEGAARARAALRPEVPAAITVAEYSKIYGDIQYADFLDALTEQTKAIKQGDLTQAESLLVAQAHTLDAIFNTLARKAINSEYMDQLDRYLRLGLRAQAQCRATLEALGEMKQPRSVAFVNQANIAHGHQQVNNGASRAGETQSPPNELLEQKDGQRLDTGTARTPSQADPQTEAVGAVDRPEDI